MYWVKKLKEMHVFLFVRSFSLKHKEYYECVVYLIKKPIVIWYANDIWVWTSHPSRAMMAEQGVGNLTGFMYF